MKKIVTTVLFSVAFSFGAWMVSKLNGTPDSDPSAALRQEIAVSQNSDDPFAPAKPNPAAEAAARVLSDPASTRHPMRWTVVALLALGAGGVVFAVRSVAAKAAASFAPSSVQPEACGKPKTSPDRP